MLFNDEYGTIDPLTILNKYAYHCNPKPPFAIINKTPIKAMLLVSTMRIRNAEKYVEEAQPCVGLVPVNEAN